MSTSSEKRKKSAMDRSDGITPKRKRKFPGPAGILPKLVNVDIVHKLNSFVFKKCYHLCSVWVGPKNRLEFDLLSMGWS